MPQLAISGSHALLEEIILFSELRQTQLEQLHRKRYEATKNLLGQLLCSLPSSLDDAEETDQFQRLGDHDQKRGGKRFCHPSFRFEQTISLSKGLRGSRVFFRQLQIIPVWLFVQVAEAGCRGGH